MSGNLIPDMDTSVLPPKPPSSSLAGPHTATCPRTLVLSTGADTNAETQAHCECSLASQPEQPAAPACNSEAAPREAIAVAGSGDAPDDPADDDTLPVIEGIEVLTPSAAATNTLGTHTTAREQERRAWEESRDRIQEEAMAVWRRANQQPSYFRGRLWRPTALVSLGTHQGMWLQAPHPGPSAQSRLRSRRRQGQLRLGSHRTRTMPWPSPYVDQYGQRFRYTQPRDDPFGVVRRAEEAPREAEDDEQSDSSTEYDDGNYTWR